MVLAFTWGCIPLLGPKGEILRARDYHGYPIVNFEAGVYLKKKKKHTKKPSGITDCYVDNVIKGNVTSFAKS